MTNTNNMSAAELIELSEREDRIVHAAHDDAVAADLLADSDGTADTSDTDGDALAEYWGATWRVHLHH